MNLANRHPISEVIDTVHTIVQMPEFCFVHGYTGTILKYLDIPTHITAVL